ARPRLVELLPRKPQLLFLRFEYGQALAPVTVGGFIGPRVAVNGLLKRRLRPQAFGKPILHRRLPQAPLPFRPRYLCTVLGRARTGIELQPVEHAAPARLGLFRALLGPIPGQLVAVLRG